MQGANVTPILRPAAIPDTCTAGGQQGHVWSIPAWKRINAGVRLMTAHTAPGRAEEERWQAHLGCDEHLDEPAEVAFYCPGCAAPEFGGG
jgi:hypothetical protein